jgi:hypothetical protein
MKPPWKHHSSCRIQKMIEITLMEIKKPQLGSELEKI